MTRRTRFGVLTPSSNTSLEPLTTALIGQLPDCSVHFSRFKVTDIALSPQALGQFDDSKILAAAELLADARVDVIGWSGTAAGWLGFDTDLRLCERIRERTGIPATTAVLALNELLALGRVAQLGFVTPYTDDVQQKIIDNYRAVGIACPGERHLGITVNFDFAMVAPETLERLIREVASSGCQAITTFCTNLQAAQLAERIEADTGVALLDTVGTTVWGMLRATGIDPRRIQGWGRLFSWGG